MKRELFSKKPLIWFHYILIVFLIFGVHWLSGIIGLEGWTMENKWIGWTVLFIFYYIFIAIGDQLIHYVIKED